jgi:hypothetical protein
MLLNLIHPVFNGAETLSISNVICHNDAVCPLVVTACDCLESLLAGSIPL